MLFTNICRALCGTVFYLFSVIILVLEDGFTQSVRNKGIRGLTFLPLSSPLFLSRPFFLPPSYLPLPPFSVSPSLCYRRFVCPVGLCSETLCTTRCLSPLLLWWVDWSVCMCVCTVQVRANIIACVRVCVRATAEVIGCFLQAIKGDTVWYGVPLKLWCPLLMSFWNYKVILSILKDSLWRFQCFSKFWAVYPSISLCSSYTMRRLCGRCQLQSSTLHCRNARFTTL